MGRKRIKDSSLISCEREGKLKVIESKGKDKFWFKLKDYENREDNLIPVEESRRLADALATKTRISYTEFSIFEHIEPTKPMDMIPFLKESFKLIKHMYKILRYTS